MSIYISDHVTWREDGSKIPMIDLTGKQQPLRSSELGCVLIAYEATMHDETMTFHMVIDVPFLRQVRANMGRIAAIKYVRSTSMSLDNPYGISLLHANNLCDALLPSEDFVAEDDRRNEAQKALNDVRELREQLNTERNLRWELKEQLYRYEDRFGTLEPRVADEDERPF